MAPARCFFAVAIGVVGWGVACASTDPAALYKRGVAAYENDEMKPAADALDVFTTKSCGPGATDSRCREAYIKLGHARERLGSPGAAWAAYDAALGFGPHTRDAAVQADLNRTQQQLKDKHAQASDRSPVILRYRDEVGEEYTARSVLISFDFEPVLAKDKNASELHSSDFAKVYGGSVAAGEHVIVVETIHDCRAGSGVQCARAKVRKAWPFRSAAHTPTTVEIRAIGEEGPSGGASRPNIELSSH
jgi:hypothetical protein